MSMLLRLLIRRVDLLGLLGIAYVPAAEQTDHLFVFIATNKGIRTASGRCLHGDGPHPKCVKPSHLAILCQAVLKQLHDDHPDLDEQIQKSLAYNAAQGRS